MLYKCANEACHTSFRRLREGKLFRVETEYFADRRTSPPSRKNRPSRRIEHYWLCDACAPFVTLTFDKNRGVITVLLPNGEGEKTVRMASVEAVTANSDPEEQAMQPTLGEVRK
jgi:hypothetical protein